MNSHSRHLTLSIIEVTTSLIAEVESEAQKLTNLALKSQN